MRNVESHWFLIGKFGLLSCVGYTELQDYMCMLLNEDGSLCRVYFVMKKVVSY